MAAKPAGVVRTYEEVRAVKWQREAGPEPAAGRASTSVCWWLPLRAASASVLSRRPLSSSHATPLGTTQEMAFIERVTPYRYRVRPGFVPGMHVPGEAGWGGRAQTVPRRQQRWSVPQALAGLFRPPRPVLTHSLTHSTLPHSPSLSATHDRRVLRERPPERAAPGGAASLLPARRPRRLHARRQADCQRGGAAGHRQGAWAACSRRLAVASFLPLISPLLLRTTGCCCS